MQANKTVEVFCSYARSDESWRQELEAHLSFQCGKVYLPYGIINSSLLGGQTTGH